MTGKGHQCQIEYSRRVRRIREGKEKPIEYTMTLKEAIRTAGL